MRRFRILAKLYQKPFSQVKRDPARRGCGQQKLCSHLELKRLLNRDSRVWFSVFNRTLSNCKNSTWSTNNGCVSSPIPSRPVRPCYWGNNYRMQTQVCNWTCTLRAEEEKSLGVCGDVCVCVCLWGECVGCRLKGAWVTELGVCKLGSVFMWPRTWQRAKAVMLLIVGRT